VVAGKIENKVAFQLTGITRTYFTDANGKEYNKIFTQHCNFIGPYTSLTRRTVNKVNIQALTDCDLMVADYNLITSLYDKHPTLERFARRLSEAFFAQKEKREIEFVLLPAEERYAIFQQEFPGLENEIPQYHVASYLGITPTQLSRIRSKR
jgi:CRP-like cAMP-binding protein